MIIPTGVFVSADHVEAVRQRARGVVAMPVIKVQGAWLDEEARLNFGDWLDALAQSYGLPPPEKDRDGDSVHYGMDLEGQFTRWSGAVDVCPEQVVLPKGDR